MTQNENHFHEQFEAVFRQAIDDVLPAEKVDPFVWDHRDHRQRIREHLLTWLNKWLHKQSLNHNSTHQ